MAVYTHLTDRQLERYARWFGLESLHEARGVPGGTINTIYSLKTADGRFILRLLENRSRTDARFEEALLRHLHGEGISVPRMLESPSHGGVISLGTRQHLSVFEWMPGRELAPFELQPEHAGQIGTYLARLHAATASLRRQRRNRFLPEHIDRKLGTCERYVAGDVPQEMRRHVGMLRRELDRFRWPTRVPLGIIHADLFVDNAFFKRGRLTGVLDFEMACSGPLIYDVAVALLDWAFERDRFVRPRARALLAGYQKERPLNVSERAALFPMCRFIATRYATTRFYDFEVTAIPEEDRTYKDYRHYVARLAALRTLGAAGLRELVNSTRS
ncbi:MAG: homoserine kinase [Myxococcota bacterium]